MAQQNTSSAGRLRPNNRKPLILNAAVMNTPSHVSPGLWRHPTNHSAEYTNLKYWTDLAQRLDDANFHTLFITDSLGSFDVYKGPHNAGPAIESGAQFPINDPLLLVPSMAAATTNLVFGVTASVTYDHPYSLARRFSTLDHLTNGRVAWNVVTSFLTSAARNHGLEEQIEHDERYRRADEFLDVTYKLWEGSWRDDAVTKNIQSGQYANSDLVQEIHHRGKYFKVPGPHVCEPSPQRTPFIFQAGSSKAGKDFAAKHAEAVFVGSQLPELVRPTVDAIKSTAQEKYGRDPNHIKVVVSISVIVAETDEAATRKRDELLSYGNIEGALTLFGGWTGIDMSKYSDDEDFRFVNDYAIRSVLDKWSSTVPGSENLPWSKKRIAEYIMLGGYGAKVTGSPETVVNELERWIEIGGVDGFNFGSITVPGTFDDLIKFVLPVLKERGWLRADIEKDKEGATAREVFLGTPRLTEDHPGHRYTWARDGDRPVFPSNTE
ncbi:hypothetical protein A1O3_09550 [Capronia epimyces CBS 606.96]|uniref:Luciferase-like domain-containing protein n=1 Tax=Capronia epimyces CBS 606.96 TaxID=1182542 RepID=W9Y4C8_9EURO|nr:uncharacterized protein A1O3_09550 [Capronia epimyces CBS 606.96]EXJ77324.1 hypothetical protein A1O3_09550 [Capronia epimyces CBS 606.96]